MDQSLDFNKTRLSILYSVYNKELFPIYEKYQDDLTNKAINLFGDRFEKSASLDSFDLQYLRNHKFPHLFADSIQQLYPCHTRDATILSSAYFFEFNKEKDSPKYKLIRDKIYKAAEYFDCLNIVQSIEEKSKERQNKQENKVKIKDDRAIFTIETPQDLNFVADYLIQNKNNFSFKTRNEASKNILKIAGRMGVELSDYQTKELMKMSGMGEYIDEDLRYFLINLKGLIRQNRFLSNENKEVIMKEVDDIIKQASNKKLSREDRMKLIEVYENLRRIGKVAEYLPPEDYLFNITDKDIEEARNSLIYNKKYGKFYHPNTLKFDKSILVNFMGHKFASAVLDEDGKINIKKLKNVIEKSCSDVDLMRFEDMIRFVNL